MCFEFGSRFGNSRRQDLGGERPVHKPAHGGARDRRGNRGNGAYYGGAADHKVPTPATYHHLPPTAVEEAGHKAYHDGGAWKDHHVDAGGHGRYAAYVQDKADYDTPKLPAWHNKVGDDAGYTYTARLYETAADRRENSAMDYHDYPTTTANTTTLVRY